MARKRTKRRRDEDSTPRIAEQSTSSNKAVKRSHKRRNKRKRDDIVSAEDSKRQKSQPSPADVATTQQSPAYFSSPGWKRHVLYQLFPSIRSLASYLSSGTVCLSQPSFLTSDDAAGYVGLLHDTLVVPFVPFVQQAAQSFTPPGTASERLRALLMRTVDRTLYKPAAHRPAPSTSIPSRTAGFQSVPTPLPLSASFSSLPSVLSLGFRLARGDSDSALVERPSVESVDINSVSSHIQQSREWQLLTERVGECVMAHLLLQCFCFAPLPNLCFMQLTGPPLPDAMKAAKVMASSASSEAERSDKRPSLKRAASDMGSLHPSPVKRTSTDPTVATISAGLAPPSRSSSAVPAPAVAGAAFSKNLLQRVIPQSAILYQQSSRWQAGLPPRHALNVLQPSKTGARRLLAVVFDLPSVGTLNATPSSTAGRQLLAL